MVKCGLAVLILLAFALPGFGAGNHNYQTTYPVACGEVWSAVKTALANPANYKDVQSDEAKMSAEYNVKHSIHWSVAGAINQGKNRVNLVSVGNTCEMNVMSMYSGLSHNDAGDFKKRVEEAMGTAKSAPAAPPAKPEAPANAPAN